VGNLESGYYPKTKPESSIRYNMPALPAVPRTPLSILTLLFITCYLLFVTACANIQLPFLDNIIPAVHAPSAPSGPSSSPASFFSSLPEANGLVFIGATGRRSDPKETLQLALEDAARQVALFNKVSGEFTVVNNVGSGAFDYDYDTSASLYYDIEGSKQYVGSLQFNPDTDTLETENTFFIRTTYRSALPFSLKYKPVHRADQKPDWVDNPPFDIEGYEVGVGFSNRRSSLSDTYKNSSNNAVFYIIRSINAASKSSDMLYQTTESLFGYKTMNNNTVRSYGTLTGFYVLDTWMDPHDKTVWTLAIAVKP